MAVIRVRSSFIYYSLPNMYLVRNIDDLLVSFISYCLFHRLRVPCISKLFTDTLGDDSL